MPISDAQAAETAARVIAISRACRFEGFEFDFRRGELRGPDGAPVALRPKAEALLREFLAQPGRLFSRDELIAALWPAAVVTDDSLVQCVGELRTALDDHAQRLIRTVSRRGYRWEGAVSPATPVPVADAAVPLPPSVPSEPAPAALEAPALKTAPRRSVRRSWLRALVLLGATAALVGAGVALLRPAVAPIDIDEAITARGTVAVMPFLTAADDPALRLAADAVADEIVAQFATRRGMRGIGRAATSAFDAAAPPLDRIAKALKATCVVTGRVARVAGETLSFDVQITAVANGEVVWAKRYESTAANRAQVFTDVGLHVVNAIRHRGFKGPAEPPREPGYQPDAVELTLMGWRDLDRVKSVQDVWRARSRFQAAIRDDPRSVIALNGLAATYAIEGGDPVNRPLTAEQMAEFQRIADQARALAPDDSTALLTWGYLQILRGRADLALPAVERASRLVPSYPAGHIYIGRALLMLGRTDEVQARAERAVKLSPNEGRRAGNAYALAAEAALMLGDDQRARDLAQRAIAAFPANSYAHGLLAAVEALTGRSEQASAAMAAMLKLWPTATVANFDDLRKSNHPVYLAQRARLYEGLRKAGLPGQ